MRYSPSDPPTWPVQADSYRTRRRVAPRPAQPPRRATRGPRHRGPGAVWVVLFVLLALFAGLGWLAVRLHNGGGLPGTTPGLDQLSPELASYVAAQHGDMGVAVYDVTHDRSYAANANQPYILASSAKVYLMLADFDRLEASESEPGDDDMQLLTAMIEHSDNNAAQAIYDQLGDARGMQRYLAKIGITDYVPCADGWGCAKASAADMVHALTLLQKGQVLNADDRTLALQLMATIEADQRMGVGETAPNGAKVYLKDGWLNYPDPAKWNLNSSGIVVTGNETYIVSVYSQNQPGEDWTKVDHICAEVARALT